MGIKEKKLLQDILDAIHKIEAYLGPEKEFSRYERDPLLQDGVERNLITIGEAMAALLKIRPDIPISSARRIVDARNKITHGYDEIENLQVWNIIVNHLPVLKREAEGLLL